MDKYYIEFGGDPSKDGENYKRYSSKNIPFKAWAPDVEVLELVEIKHMAKAMVTINEMQNLIKNWMSINSVMGQDMQHAFNIGAKFNADYPELFNKYLEVKLK